MRLHILSESETNEIPWLRDYLQSETRTQSGANMYSFLTNNMDVCASMKIKKEKDVVHLQNITMSDSIRADVTTYSWLRYILKWAKSRNSKAITVSVREDDRVFLSYCKSVGFITLRTFKSQPIYDYQPLHIYKLIYYL